MYQNMTYVRKYTVLHILFYFPQILLESLYLIVSKLIKNKIQRRKCIFFSSFQWYLFSKNYQVTGRLIHRVPQWEVDSCRKRNEAFARERKSGNRIPCAASGQALSAFNQVRSFFVHSFLSHLLTCLFAFVKAALHSHARAALQLVNRSLACEFALSEEREKNY